MSGTCGGDWRTSRALSASRPPPPRHQSSQRLCPASPGFPLLEALVAVDHLAATGDDRFRQDGQAGPDPGRRPGHWRPVGAAGHVSARPGGEGRRAGAAVVRCSVDDGGGRGAVRPAQLETILRAVRAGEVPVAGYVGRSPRISREALVGWLATKAPSAPPVARQPRRARGRKASDAVEAAWQRLG